jgi:hypothetical protein
MSMFRRRALVAMSIGPALFLFTPSIAVAELPCQNCRLIVTQTGEATSLLKERLSRIRFNDDLGPETPCSDLVNSYSLELTSQMVASSIDLEKRADYILSNSFGRNILKMAEEDLVLSKAGLVEGDRGKSAVCRQKVALAARRIVIDANSARLQKTLTEWRVASIQTVPSAAGALDVIVRHSAQHHGSFANRVFRIYLRLLKRRILDPLSYAGLADAIAVVERSEQIYGTRIGCIGEKWEYSPKIRSIIQMQLRRREIGYFSDDEILGTPC